MDIYELSEKMDVRITQMVYLMNNRKDIYYLMKIKKRDGGTRNISIPNKELKKVQRKILRRFLYWYPVHPNCCGFVRGRSIFTNAFPHKNKRALLKLDIRNFFPSITSRRINGYFKNCLGLDKKSSHHLTELITLNGRLPQGAPTSPYIANLICANLDLRLAKLAKKLELDYTRYADDMTFSGRKIKKSMFNSIVRIIESEGFKIYPRKTRFLSNKNRQIVTGLVVNNSINVPRKERRKLRAIIHNCITRGVTTQNRIKNKNFMRYLKGKIDFVNMANPTASKKLYSEFNNIDWTPLLPVVTSKQQTDKTVILFQELDKLNNLVNIKYEKEIEINDFVALLLECKNWSDLSNHSIVLNRIISDKLASFSRAFLVDKIPQNNQDKKSTIEKFLEIKGAEYSRWNEPLKNLNLLANVLQRHPIKCKKTPKELEDIFKKYCESYPSIDYPHIWNNLIEDLISRLQELFNCCIDYKSQS